MAKTTKSPKDVLGGKKATGLIDLIQAIDKSISSADNVSAAQQRATHDERATLLVPVLAEIRKVAESDEDFGRRNAVLGQFECRLLLRCLSEAGYVDTARESATTVRNAPEDGNRIAYQNRKAA